MLLARAAKSRAAALARSHARASVSSVRALSSAVHSRSLLQSSFAPTQATRSLRPSLSYNSRRGFSTRKLNDIVDVAKLENESVERIEEVWTEYHSSQDGKTGTTLTAEEFDTIIENSRKSRRFVFPIPVDERSTQADAGPGKFFVMYAEWQDNHCIMTSLEAHRMNSGSSYPYFVLTLYDELIDSRDVCLVRGDIVSEYLDKKRCEKLMELAVSYYLRPENYAYVEQFNHRSKEFDIPDYFARCGYNMKENLVGG